MTRPNSAPRLERLADRILPSVSPIGIAAHAAAAQPGEVQTPAPLSGQGRGVYSYDAVQSGAGTEYRLHGGATLSGMGAVSVGGSVHSVGFIREGRAGGELTFTDARGSVTVELTGPIQAGFSPLPGSFRFRVVGETGAYAGKRWADGTLTLTLTPAPTAAGTHPEGVFSIALNPPKDHNGGGHAG